MPQHSIRLAYVVEFLLSLMVVLFVWGEVSGQGHMDLIPWYWKLGLSAGLSFGVVQATASAAEQESAWNPRSFRLLLVVLAFVAGIGFLTCRYHLLKPVEEDMDNIEESTAADIQRGRKQAEKRSAI